VVAGAQCCQPVALDLEADDDDTIADPLLRVVVPPSTHELRQMHVAAGAQRTTGAS
jgi:hypothetical protein